MELLMRNGSPSNKLTLVNNNANGRQDDTGGPAAYYSPQPENTVFADESSRAQKTFLVFLAISIACAAATIGTGSYAAWLSRQQAARQTLTDVDEILKSCQSRMSQLEADLQRLPHRQA
jgi:cytochrome c-type biogenesis protein CcmH/NrfG